MIDAEFCHTMARYNMWQNASHLAAADSLEDAARQLDRGSFFGSIIGTMNHLMWADRMWMSRFAGWDKPAGGIGTSSAMAAKWDAFKQAREIDDARILDWAFHLEDSDLAGDLIWYSGSLQAEVSKPKWLCVQHFFNHQTHHRGQIHAMLTAAKALPDDTDLFLMPEGD